MELDIRVEKDNDQIAIFLTGEIDAFTAPKLKEELAKCTVQTGKTIQVDLEQVEYMDSTGLGIFIGALKSAKEHDSSLKLVHLQDRVFRLFKITGLDEIMDIKPVIQGGKQ